MDGITRLVDYSDSESNPDDASGDEPGLTTFHKTGPNTVTCLRLRSFGKTSIKRKTYRPVKSEDCEDTLLGFEDDSGVSPKKLRRCDLTKSHEQREDSSDLEKGVGLSRSRLPRDIVTPLGLPNNITSYSIDKKVPCISTQLGSKKPGKRRNFCPYCKKLFTNFSRHLVAKHADEDDVNSYVALKHKSPRTRKRRRATITNRIRYLGNRMYNLEIIEGRRNDAFLPSKRSSNEKHIVDNVSHVSCKHCLGFFRKQSLYKHIRNCEQYTERVPSDEGAMANKRQILPLHGELLVKNNEEITKHLKDEVFPNMKKDLCSVVAQGDRLICKFGSSFRFSHRKGTQVSYCSTKMRTLAKLYLTMKKLKPNINEFFDCISPKNYDVLVESVRQMSQFDPTVGDTKVPSVPSRICSSLKKCADMVKSDAIKSETLSREEKTETIHTMNDFLHLMDKDWAAEVSTNSENSRKRMKVIKKDLLPDPDDIRTFSQYIHNLCPRYTSELKNEPTIKNYDRLAKLIISHIITLNRRRANETVEITIEAYRLTLEILTDYGEDLQNVITEEELMSSRELVIFYVPANKNLKKVPILLTKVFHCAIDVLIESHENLGIKSRFIFGRPGNTELFNGSAVLRQMANKALLRSPKTFTSNALRHHVATWSPLQSRSEKYAKRLSKFMGHDLGTHENYYEMPLPLVQKTIVGHQLLKMTLPKATLSNLCSATSSNNMSILPTPRATSETLVMPYLPKRTSNLVTLDTTTQIEHPETTEFPNNHDTSWDYDIETIYRPTMTKVPLMFEYVNSSYNPERLDLPEEMKCTSPSLFSL